MKYVLETTEELENLIELMLETPEADIEQHESIQATLADIKQDLETNLEPFGNLLKNVRASADYLKDEGNKLLARSRTLNRRADWIQRWILRVLKAADLKKMISGTRSFTVTNNSTRKIDIHDPARVLEIERYVLVKREVDTVNLKKDLEADIEVPGAILMERGQHLRIK